MSLAETGPEPAPQNYDIIWPSEAIIRQDGDRSDWAAVDLLFTGEDSLTVTLRFPSPDEDIYWHIDRGLIEDACTTPVMDDDSAEPVVIGLGDVRITPDNKALNFNLWGQCDFSIPRSDFEIVLNGIHNRLIPNEQDETDQIVIPALNAWLTRQGLSQNPVEE